MPSSPDQKGHAFSQLIRAGRKKKAWTQEDLIEESGVSRSTILRWEAGKVERPDPEQVRAVFRALGLDPREAAVALGYLTREEIGLSPEPPRVFDATVEEVIEILQDPNVSDAEKSEWVQYLKFRTGRPVSGRRRRTG